ncbi:MAG: hypothetical protein IT285_09945 [Bdellovibrionales bacterium]|nr:hypothetical protein [Bdellovibrionales bacterium]
MNPFRIRWAALAAFLALFSTQAGAAGFGNLEDLSTLDQDEVDALLKTVGEGTAHKSYAGAATLGLALGIELGVDVALISPSSEFKQLITEISGGSAPDPLPFPRFHLRKGLPGNFDFGFAILPKSGNPGEEIGSWAVEAQWAPISMKNGLSVAGRVSYSSSDVAYFSTSTFALEGLGSFKMGPLEPYMGLGMNFTSGSLAVDDATNPLPGDVEGEGTYVTPKIYFGLSLKLLILKFVGQYDINASGNNSFGLRAALSF